MEILRTLEEVCEESDFHIKLAGNVYCLIKPSQVINCKFRSHATDQNGLYACLNLKYNKEIDYKEWKVKN